MKHWVESDSGITIRDGEEYDYNGRIFKVYLEKDGSYTLVEGCDEYFHINVSKAEMLELIHELEEWVRSK